jgi:uncharacterized protein YndB with AHSA1/START domain
MTRETANALHYELEIEVLAPRELVWMALTGHVAQWWLPDFLVGGPDRGGMVFEPRVGGRMFEDWGGGAGQLWYTVVGMDPPHALDLAGQLTAAFGGPGSTHLRVTLEDEGEATRLRVSDGIFGRVDEETALELAAGWRRLFTEGLKEYVESDTVG